MSAMEKFLFGCSPELKAAIDEAKGDGPRNPFVENILWQSKTIREAAKRIGVKPQKRPEDSRGLWAKEKSKS